jgi:hypothetical protein
MRATSAMVHSAAPPQGVPEGGSSTVPVGGQPAGISGPSRQAAPVIVGPLRHRRTPASTQTSSGPTSSASAGTSSSDSVSRFIELIRSCMRDEVRRITLYLAHGSGLKIRTSKQRDIRALWTLAASAPPAGIDYGAWSLHGGNPLK